MDIDAVLKAYPNVTKCNSKGAWDKDGKAVTIDQSKIDTTRAELDKEWDDAQYQRNRTGGPGSEDGKTNYPTLSEQLDLLYWDKKNGTNKWVEAIDKVKSDNPKPSESGS